MRSKMRSVTFVAISTLMALGVLLACGGREGEPESPALRDAGSREAESARPDAAAEQEGDRPGTCVLEDATVPDTHILGCDYGLACASWSALDGGRPERYKDDASLEYYLTCVGKTDAAPCGGFWCGAGCTCQDPIERRCGCMP